jgi:hypothetical protein
MAITQGKMPFVFGMVVLAIADRGASSSRSMQKSEEYL